jgi:hypothetical protein
MCFIVSKVDGITVAINPLDCRNYTLLNIVKRGTFVMHQLSFMMIEVFKTNVQEKDRSMLLIKKLLDEFPASKINFDLEDCDKVLRVEGQDFCARKIIELLKLNGHYCEILT